MKPELRNEVRRNALWFGALGVALAVLLGGAGAGLAKRRSRVSKLEAELEAKRQQVAIGAPTAGLQEQLDAARQLTGEWLALVKSEPQRLGAISDSARSSGLQIVALQDAERSVPEGSGLLCASHRVRSVGSYRQVAEFLSALQESRGLVAVDELELRSDPNVGGLLSASMEVAWFAPDPDAPAAEEDVP